MNCHCGKSLVPRQISLPQSIIGYPNAGENLGNGNWLVTEWVCQEHGTVFSPGGGVDIDRKAETTAQGKSDQFTFSCCAAEHEGKRCFLFGVRIDDEGRQWAIISPWVTEVPANEVETYSRKKTIIDSGFPTPESGLIPLPDSANPVLQRGGNPNT